MAFTIVPARLRAPLLTCLALLPCLVLAANAPPPPPPATPEQLAAFIARIRPSLNSLIVSTTFIAVFVCMLIASFYFSTRDIRRSPVFVLNVVTMCLAVAAGGMIDRSAVSRSPCVRGAPPVTARGVMRRRGNVSRQQSHMGAVIRSARPSAGMARSSLGSSCRLAASGDSANHRLCAEPVPAAAR